jgi:hypothetical protein
VSGQFHLIVGMLYLFGFRLPETHHKYFLVSSISDFWRRINIYWKDFMLKVFYYPAYFKLRRLGNTVALVLATLFVFLMTWFLHAYQWFWLRGTILFVWQDILFWTILGMLVVVNLALGGEARQGAEAREGDWTGRSLSTLTLKTVGTFCFICILWSFWTTESIADWFSPGAVVGEKLRQISGLRRLRGGRAHRRRDDWRGGGSKLAAKPPAWRSALTTMISLVCFSPSESKISTRITVRPSSVIQPLVGAPEPAGQRGARARVLRAAPPGQSVQLPALGGVLKRPKSWLDVEGAS